MERVLEGVGSELWCGGSLVQCLALISFVKARLRQERAPAGGGATPTPTLVPLMCSSSQAVPREVDGGDSG